MHKISERGSKFLLISGVLVEKQDFEKRDGSIPFFIFGLWWLLVDVGTRS